jgi:hypothetical protein
MLRHPDSFRAEVDQIVTDHNNEVSKQINWSMFVLTCLLIGWWAHYQYIHPYWSWCALGL